MTAAEHLAAAIAALDGDANTVAAKGALGDEMARELRHITAIASSAAARLARVDDRLVRFGL
jgi:hypothetical protein